MSNKLQNIKAVKQLLTGAHKSQQQSHLYTGKLKTRPEDHEVIETFENGTPKIWIERDAVGFGTRFTQHDGFRTKEPENSILKEIRTSLSVPDKCPNCNTDMRNNEKALNFKFYFKRKKCFGCVLTEERNIKQQGEKAWKEYQINIMSANAEDWIKDAEKEVEIIKTQVVKTWQNAQGEYETADVSHYIKKIETDFQKLKDDVRDNLILEEEHGKY